jgi:NADPH:quinone reductase-like Zn-dependent oxidoreductase
MVMAAMIHEKGSPDGFRWEDVEVGDPGPAELFDVIDRGALKVSVIHVYPLSQAAEAHRAIEERRTTGSTVLLPFA